MKTARKKKNRKELVASAGERLCETGNREQSSGSRLRLRLALRNFSLLVFFHKMQKSCFPGSSPWKPWKVRVTARSGGGGSRQCSRVWVRNGSTEAVTAVGVHRLRRYTTLRGTANDYWKRGRSRERLDVGGTPNSGTSACHFITYIKLESSSIGRGAREELRGSRREEKEHRESSVASKGWTLVLYCRVDRARRFLKILCTPFQRRIDASQGVSES